MFYKTVQLETMIYSLSFVSFFWKILSFKYDVFHVSFPLVQLILSWVLSLDQLVNIDCMLFKTMNDLLVLCGKQY